jgi:hypothetical protein
MRLFAVVSSGSHPALFSSTQVCRVSRLMKYPGKKKNGGDV